MELIGLISEKFGLFLIVFARVSGIFSIAPCFGSKNVPAYVKIGLAFFITAVLLPVITHKYSALVLPQDLLPYIGLVVTEFMFGLIIGYASFLIFAGVQMAGAAIDMQIGFSIVSVLDPQSGVQIPLLGTFKYVLAILLFLAVNGHHVLLAAISESFQRVPINAALAHEAVTVHIVSMFSTSFTLAFKMAMPVLVALFLVEVAFGIMARTVPQMNVFMVGIPAKIIIGLFILAISLPVFFMIVQWGFTGMYADLYRLLDMLAK